jgi:hypothetical protein
MTTHTATAAPAHASDLPVFSPRLDEIMASMLKGQTPNVGRFCGYCYTPVARKAESCAHCARSTSDYAPVSAIPSEFFALYKRMRKRESLIVNSFAYGGLAIGLVLFIVLVYIAVYWYDQSLWMLAAATLVFMVGGRVLAGLLGGWIGDNIGYDYAHRKLAVEWEQYARDREAQRHAAAETSEPVAVP